MKLKLGKMTGQELAEWLGISYNGTYRKKPGEHLKKLRGYCEFEQVRGGAIINKIYTDTYYGDLEKDIVKDYINEIQEKKNRLSSVAGMTRKFKKKTKYQEIEFDTLKYQLTNAALTTFGKTNTIYTINRGAYGCRYYVWAIKLDDYNNYRYFTFEEKKMFEALITEYYAGIGPEEIIQLSLLEEELKEGEITSDEFFKLRERAGLNFFDQCITKFKEKTGLIVARAQLHEIIDADKETDWYRDKDIVYKPITIQECKLREEAEKLANEEEYQPVVNILEES